jgi:hypothetical protein
VFVFNDVKADSTSLVSVGCSTPILDYNAHEKPILPRQRMSKKKFFFVDFS